MAPGGYFPPPFLPDRKDRLCIAKQNSRQAPSSAALRPMVHASDAAGW